MGLPVADRFDDWRDEKTNRLETRLREVDALAVAGELPEASLTEEGLSISPIRKNENEAADAIIRRLYALLPRLRVTELFAEVHGWTGFADRFAHLRTGASPDDARALMTALLADATNLGLARMARSSGAFSPSRKFGATAIRRPRMASFSARADMARPAPTTTPNTARSRA